MKRALIITVLLLALSISGLCLAHGSANAARDKVELTENVIYGDKAAARGAVVESKIHYDHHLFWDTEYTIGDEPASETKFRFSQKKLYGDSVPEYTGVTLESGLSFGINYGCDMDMSRKQTGLAEAYRQLYNETPDGQEGKKTIYLKDYYDYYPLAINISLPGNYFNWRDGYPEETAYSTSLETEKMIKDFSEFFKIPVVENEGWEITLAKDDNGSVYSMGSGNIDGDSFYLWTISVFTDDACFFTFNNRSTMGKTVDTSQIPGGYGIYRLPYYEGDGGYISTGEGKYSIRDGVSVGELSNAYPLNPETELINLLINEEKTKLLLVTREQKKCVLTVIDAKTMETLQRMELAELGEENNVYSTRSLDGFLVIELWDSQIIVVTENENGEYEHSFTAPFTDAENPLYYLNYDSAMDWDGERLVITDFLRHDEYGELCGFFAAVCDKTGLLYYGEYQSSLDVGSFDHSSRYDCRPLDSSPIAVSWG